MDKTLMSQVINEAKVTGIEPWEHLYQKNITPWDKGQVAPALLNLIQSNRIPNQGRILVPGCGRGVDVITLANTSSKRIVYGIDIAPSAVDDCNKLLCNNPLPNALFICTDFFTFTENDLIINNNTTATPTNNNNNNNNNTVPQFDMIYDYTFLCALPPELRSLWSNRISQLVRSGGTLITLMYPLNDNRPLNDGPPYPLSIDLYRSLLPSNHWLEIDISPCQDSFPARLGREALGIWERI